MEINSNVLRLNTDGNKKEDWQGFWGKCALLSELAILVNDRTEAGEKYTQAGIDYTNKRITELGFGNIKRIQYEGKDKQINHQIIKPTVEFIAAYNDTDIVTSFRGTHNKAGWAINFDCSKTRTVIGEVHQGWFEDVEAVWQEILDWLSSIPNVKSKRLWNGSHSKGSAEGQIWCTLIDSIYSIEMFCGIGSPRPFEKDTAKNIEKKFKNRMFWTKNNNDAVCITPSKLQGYDSCGQMLYVDSSGNVHFGMPLYKQFFDGIAGFIKGAPNIFINEYFDAGEDHMPCYYFNSFSKAAGCERRIKRWEQKFM